MNKLTKVFLLVMVVALAGVGGYMIATRVGKQETSSTTGSSTSEVTGAGGAIADYSGKGLSVFPKEVLKKTNTTTLNLSNNNLTGALPAEIHDLKNLVSLDVSNNEMTGVPAEVGQLKKLKVLNYANNKLTGLPMELGNLTQLQTLDLSGNPNVSQTDLAKIKAKLTATTIKL